MTEIGYFLSCEEHDGTTLLRQATQVEQAGMRRVWISDHYHPWTDRQGESPFVWCVIGGIAAMTGLHVTTAVTCPTFRIHPAVVAQAAATAAAMMPGRFTLGVGSGELLNEHILGDHWPPTGVRQDRLREAVELMRALWEGGRVDWRGEHFTVEAARIYTRPDEPIPVLISAYGPKAMDLVVSHGDGWITTSPDTELMDQFRRSGGKGRTAAGAKVCWGPDEAAARRLAHEVWRSSALPGEMASELPAPAHFEQATQLVTEDMVAEAFPCGPDPERHVAALQPYLDAGFDELYIQQIGPDTQGFLDFYDRELRPRLER
jgi:G6PDH family F420-dependent oxidoreductase